MDTENQIVKGMATKFSNDDTKNGKQYEGFSFKVKQNILFLTWTAFTDTKKNLFSFNLECEQIMQMARKEVCFLYL